MAIEQMDNREWNSNADDINDELSKCLSVCNPLMEIFQTENAPINCDPIKYHSNSSTLFCACQNQLMIKNMTKTLINASDALSTAHSVILTHSNNHSHVTEALEFDCKYTKTQHYSSTHASQQHTNVAELNTFVSTNTIACYSLTQNATAICILDRSGCICVYNKKPKKLLGKVEKNEWQCALNLNALVKQKYFDSISFSNTDHLNTDQLLFHRAHISSTYVAFSPIIAVYPDNENSTKSTSMSFLAVSNYCSNVTIWKFIETEDGSKRSDVQTNQTSENREDATVQIIDGLQIEFLTELRIQSTINVNSKSLQFSLPEGFADSYVCNIQFKLVDFYNTRILLLACAEIGGAVSIWSVHLSTMKIDQSAVPPVEFTKVYYADAIEYGLGVLGFN